MLSFIEPIMGDRWYIDPNGARDEVVQHVAHDFGVEIEGQEPEPQGRMRDRFTHGDYLYHSLLKLAYGFMLFEQVDRLGDDQKLPPSQARPAQAGQHPADSDQR
ncbi:MAG: hypothetical protein QOJ11_3662 [Frankiales bacterium]|jgi:hypothetical protein|nr:hypothetical protein [Frankiales bacterium]